MKKILAVFLTLVMMFTLVSCGQTNNSDGSNGGNDTGSSGDASGDTITIGLSAKLTGADAANGDRMQRAAQMAIDEVNAAGGVLGKQVVLDVQDDQTDNTAALNVANIFAGKDEVVAVVGPWNSGQITATEQVYADAQIPFFGLGTNPALLELDNDYLFLVRANDTLMASCAAELIINELEGVTTVGIMYTTNEFGTGAMEIIQEQCTAAGMEVYPEAINIGDTDVTGQILDMKNNGVDCMVVWASDAEYVLTARQSYELGLDAQVVASPAVTMDQVRELCEPDWIEGWYSITDFVGTTDDPDVTAFCEKYAADYGDGQNAELYVADVYSTFKLLFDAIERAGSTDRNAIRDAVEATDGFEMLQGVAKCDENHLLVHSAAVAQIQDYAPVYITTVTAE